MAQSRYTHVSIVADDLDESIDFYESVFDTEQIPTPAFDQTVQWLECGDLQLHLVETDAEPPEFNHPAIHVDEFEGVFQAVRDHESAEIEPLSTVETGNADGEPPAYVLPSGAVQLYVRDPTGNLVEVNAPDVDEIDSSVVTNLVDRTDVDWPTEDDPAPIYMDD